jgi:hypothetical protein
MLFTVKFLLVAYVVYAVLGAPMLQARRVRH